MFHRNDENVPRVDRTDVHDRDAIVVSVDDARVRPTGDDVTENAFNHGLMRTNWFLVCDLLCKSY
jgi:hypothetical protein